MFLPEVAYSARVAISDKAALILKIFYEIFSGYIREHPTLEFNRVKTRDTSVGWEPCSEIDSLFGDSNRAVSMRCG